MHKVEVYIVKAEITERSVDSFGDTLVPGVVEFGCDENLGAGDARVANTLADFLFVAIGEGTSLV